MAATPRCDAPVLPPASSASLFSLFSWQMPEASCIVFAHQMCCSTCDSNEEGKQESERWREDTQGREEVAPLVAS
jgi:hypothetical protein